jgi:enoyl-[acyl-carrier protein] reductase III
MNAVDGASQPVLPLTGKVALVTGGGRGIGRGVSLALAAAGCDVAVGYLRRRQEAEATCAEIDALGRRAVAIKANSGEEAGVALLVREAVATLGPIDILVANAASGVVRKVSEVDDRAWDWTFDINARSLLRLAQAVSPAMRERGWGRILSISSMGARRVTGDYAVIGASKAALEALTRYLAVELAPSGVICNCVSPGLVLTGALEYFPNRDEMIAHAERITPAGRLVTPADVGALVVWLCSEGAAMIVGQTIEIDGGYSLIAGR